MSNKEYPIVDSVESFESALERVRAAQREFALLTKEQVDRIFLAAATAANRARLPLAKMAVEETGMGVVEDKVIKNHFASEYIYNAYRDVKTCGVIEENPVYGTESSSARIPAQKRAPSPRRSSFWRRLLPRALPRESSAGSTFPRLS